MKLTTTILLLIIFSVASFAQSQNEAALSYKDLLNREIVKMSDAQKDSTFLRRFNEMRTEENKNNPSLKLKPLKYSLYLEKSAQYFVDNKKVFLNNYYKFDEYAHFDDNTDGLSNRFNKLGIKVLCVGLGGNLPVLGENLLALTFNNTIYYGCESWRSSPAHWWQIVSSENTHVGFAYKKEGNYIIIVADFAKLE